MILEICTTTREGILAAEKGKADRIELCSALELGGLTPSAALVRYAAGSKLPVNVLIRPRPGDFVYSPGEIELMADDISECRESGADGVVIGLLTKDGRIDIEGCRRLMEEAEGLDTTFHRAFDLTPDPEEALEDIIRLGFHRLLTSGQGSTAEEGAELISRLQRQAAGRIIIMAGAGINPRNAAAVAERTGVSEIHASASSPRFSSMKRVGNATMGSADASDGSYVETDQEKVAGIRQALDSINHHKGI